MSYYQNQLNVTGCAPGVEGDLPLVVKGYTESSRAYKLILLVIGVKG